MAGDGLWMYQADSGALHDFSDLDVLDYGDALALGTDPDEPFGIVLSLEDRGLVFLRTVPPAE